MQWTSISPKGFKAEGISCQPNVVTQVEDGKSGCKPGESLVIFVILTLEATTTENVHVESIVCST